MTGRWPFDLFMEKQGALRRAAEREADQAVRWAAAMAIRHGRCGVLVSHRVGTPSLVSVSADVPPGHIRHRWQPGDDESVAYDETRPMPGLEV